MKKILYIFMALALSTGCITNDLPYPVIVPNITDVVAENAQKVEIDYANRVVTLHFAETIDLRSIEISSVSFDVDIAVPSIELVGVHDLSKPLKFKVNTYNEYEWRIVAQRNVERYFTVAGQVGSSVIDPVNCRAVVTVGKDAYLTNIEVTSLKLGPKDISTYSLEPSQMTDFTHGISVEVTAFGLTEVWNLFVEITDVVVELKNINPWTRSVYATSTAIAGMDNGFRYRKKGETLWTEVEDSAITSDGGTYVAHITGLTAETLYEIVAYCGDEETPVQDFKTDVDRQLPNSSFEYTSKVAGKEYYKFYDPSCAVEDGTYMFWGSGNGEGSEGVSGSADMGAVITFVDKENKVDGNQSVCAATTEVVGMLAAGNLFTGQFDGLEGTKGGRVNFGRPWTTRPVAIKLYCMYSTGKMNIIKGFPSGVTHTVDDYDRAEIKVALGTWSYRTYGGNEASPVLINTTKPETFVDFNTDPQTVANGGLIIHHDGYILNGAAKVSADTGEWVEYTIPLNYHDINTIPTHIIISCAASQYGDYFSGCSNSKLWLDKFELIY